MYDIEDPDLNLIAFADQFVDPDPTKAQPPEEILRRARMIIATELGKDPVLWQAIRDAFKTDAIISVTPTERGVAKIDEHNWLSKRCAIELLNVGLRIYRLLTSRADG